MKAKKVTLEDFIDALVKIGNSKKAIELCEPNIMQPMQLEKWMAKRILKAEELLYDEVRKIEK